MRPSFGQTNFFKSFALTFGWFSSPVIFPSEISSFSIVLVSSKRSDAWHIKAKIEAYNRSVGVASVSQALISKPLRWNGSRIAACFGSLFGFSHTFSMARSSRGHGISRTSRKVFNAHLCVLGTVVPARMPRKSNKWNLDRLPARSDNGTFAVSRNS